MPPDQQLHTIHLMGGTAFGVQFQGNPPLEHDGGTTVCHLVLTEDEADTLRGLARINSCVKVDVSPMAGESAEQTKIRLERMGLGDSAGGGEQPSSEGTPKA